MNDMTPPEIAKRNDGHYILNDCGLAAGPYPTASAARRALAASGWQKPGRSVLRSYYVAIAYISECCPKPHAWMHRIEARTGDAAVSKALHIFNLENPGHDRSEISVNWLTAGELRSPILEVTP